MPPIPAGNRKKPRRKPFEGGTRYDDIPNGEEEKQVNTVPDEMKRIETYLEDAKDRFKCLYYEVVVNEQAAAVFVRLPLYDSLWTYELFQFVGEFCRDFAFAQPFFNVEAFPDYHLDQGSIRYMGLDISSYRYPDRFPPYQNYFNRISLSGGTLDVTPVHPENTVSLKR